MERGWIMRLPPLLLLLFNLMTPLAAAQTQIRLYENLVNRFITNYSKKSISGNLFRLLVLNLQAGANNDPATPRPLNFTMMETVCPNTKLQPNLNECKFKENGLVKQCFGIISLDTQPSINISCGGDTVGDITAKEKHLSSPATTPNSSSGATGISGLKVLRKGKK